ncbi:hypothetical protein DBT_0031 [Dissulfuribacter thermophilus]|uniref:Uncharacterized protein n=1 Tax=Dissulfuribacter thermophilus TaxID=1156395 RepID=A0A1B9F8N4_9BACT|nr:hypothetical protein DBT_0031 [Dissulfuribacter thermophilus]
MALRCKGCSKTYSISEYADKLDERTERMLGFVRSDRV